MMRTMKDLDEIRRLAAEAVNQEQLISYAEEIETKEGKLEYWKQDANWWGMIKLTEEELRAIKVTLVNMRKRQLDIIKAQLRSYGFE